MSKLDPKQKQVALILGAAVLLYLVYRWYSSNQTASASTGAAAPDTSSGDYASLAGQEQSDMAAMQGQNSQLYSQEQGDVAGLTSSIAGLGAQEQSDVSGLTGAISGYSDQFDQLTSGQAAIGGQIAALASGQQQLNRAQTASIQTHKNGPFYNYYVKVTGHKPPATVRTSNFVYEAWKSGVKATALQAKSKPHPSAPKNHQIAHPNPSHKQQTHTKPAKPKPAPKPAQKPSMSRPAPAKPAPKPPPKSVKAKPSGKRR